MEDTTIHKSLVGSRAHGLHNDYSDYDYRSIYVTPTKKILSLNHKYSGSSNIDGNQDNTSYEIGHFLQLATKANPSVLEIITKDHNTITSEYSSELLELVPYLYSPQDAFNAFTGFSRSQLRKFQTDTKPISRYKFAVAYIRTLYNLNSLLRYQQFALTVSDTDKHIFRSMKNGEFSDSEIRQHASGLVRSALDVLPDIKDHKDLNKVNEFLLKIRRDFWR